MLDLTKMLGNPVENVDLGKFCSIFLDRNSGTEFYALKSYSYNRKIIRDVFKCNKVSITTLDHIRVSSSHYGVVIGYMVTSNPFFIEVDGVLYNQNDQKFKDIVEYIRRYCNVLKLNNEKVNLKILDYHKIFLENITYTR